MTKIKICGITNYDDARAAIEAGADALGFNFAESKRRVEPGIAREILRACVPFVVGVGVFVDSPVGEIRRVLEQTGCTVVQLHGYEPATVIEQLAPYAVIKVFRVNDAGIVPPVPAYRTARGILLDTFVPGEAGGTGQRFAPHIAADLVTQGWRVIVAGGLTPENVGEVIQTVRPYGVDVSSGVEDAPGRKNHAKIRDFIAAVRAAEKV